MGSLLGAEPKQGIPVHFRPTVVCVQQVVRWWIRDGVSALVACSSGQGGLGLRMNYDEVAELALQPSMSIPVQSWAIRRLLYKQVNELFAGAGVLLITVAVAVAVAVAIASSVCGDASCSSSIAAAAGAAAAGGKGVVVMVITSSSSTVQALGKKTSQ